MVVLVACAHTKLERPVIVKSFAERQKASVKIAILGKWVNTANNGSGPLGSTLMFRSDGKVVMKDVHDKEIVVPYHLDTVEEWIKFQQRDHKQKWSPNAAKKFKELFGPCYLVFFGPEGDDSLAGQGSLLFEPVSQSLIRPLTHEWLREGPARKVLASKPKS